MGLIALACVVGLLIATEAIYIEYERGLVPADAFTYLAAGERLNAGHPLYALSPGDRPVILLPPLWTVPLVSPPLIAVLLRPVAVLGDAGGYLWWGLQLCALAASLVMLGRRLPPMLLAAAMLVLLVPTVYQIGVGNINAMLLLGAILVWRTATRGPEPAAGALSAAMAAVKLTPATLVWWLLVTRRRRAIVAAVITAIVALGVSLLGAGLGSHVEYVSLLASGTAISPYRLSVAGTAVSLGLPVSLARYLPMVVAIGGLIAVFVLRRHPAFAYDAAIVTMIFGSPTVTITWYVLLYALLAPIAWPSRQGVQPLQSRPTAVG